MTGMLTASGLLAEVRVAESLGACDFGGPLSAAERDVLRAARRLPPAEPEVVAEVRSAILAGADPLGVRFCRLKGPAERRPAGAFFTPADIVQPMVEWVLSEQVDQVVDAGAGSGRFAAAVLRRHPTMHVLAVESDPVLSLLCRAHLRNVGGDVTVLNADFLTAPIARQGRVAFVGNPPYVRHHDLDRQVKDWARHASEQLGHRCSMLAGLHAYFFLAVALRAREGDVGCFVTSAEWLDVGYGAFVRWLLIERLGLRSLHLLRATELPFQDAMTTALITCFAPGGPTVPVRLHAVERLGDFSGLSDNGLVKPAEDLARAARWSSIIAGDRDGIGGTDLVPLGVLARVHRGIATGANDFFVLRPEEACARGLMDYCRPCVASAKEVIDARGRLHRLSTTKMLLCVPPSLQWEDMQRALQDYIRMGERNGISARYLCRTRRPWWSLGTPKAAPIVMTYMGRRPPVFARNPDGLFLLNVAHGIHPRQPWPERALDRLVDFLNRESARFRGRGRVYHGGMEKFEPREVESLHVPHRASFQR